VQKTTEYTNGYGKLNHGIYRLSR